MKNQESQHSIRVKNSKLDLILLFLSIDIYKIIHLLKIVFEFYKRGNLRFLVALNSVIFVIHKQYEEK